MRSFKHPVFLICLLLFCLNQLLEWQQVYIAPLHTYLDDTLCMPIVLTIALAVERVYFSNYSLVLPLKYSVWAVLLFGIYFELVLPLMSPVYTSDALDVLFYGIGAIIFQITINNPLKPANRL